MAKTALSLTKYLTPSSLPVSQDGWTALILAAANGKEGCVKLLLDAGADKEAKDNVCGDELWADVGGAEGKEYAT